MTTYIPNAKQSIALSKLDATSSANGWHRVPETTGYIAFTRGSERVAVQMSLTGELSKGRAWKGGNLVPVAVSEVLAALGSSAP